MPFTVTVIVSLAATAAAALAASLAGTIESLRVRAVTVGLVSFLVSWSLLATVSLVVISGKQDSLAAKLEEAEERLEASERQTRGRVANASGPSDKG
jgi:hypothetical protein